MHVHIIPLKCMYGYFVVDNVMWASLNVDL